MKKTNSELFIIVCVIAILGAIISSTGCSTCASITGAHTEEAEKQGRVWAKDLGLDIKAVKCAGSDSDGDGYISCTIIEVLKDGDTRIHNKECAGAYNLNESCRDPKLVMPGNRAK